jgi:catechol 2,3-dioxygenase-like lactoylglutathione lyase family enzyme
MNTGSSLIYDRRVPPSLQHLALAVRAPERTAAYFGAALSALGAVARPALYTSDRGERPWVVAIDTSLSLMFHSADGGDVDSYRPGGVHHFAVHVDSAELVDRVAAAAREAGGRVTDGPRRFAEYRFGYYGVFLRDPEEIKWEVFCYTERPAAR